MDWALIAGAFLAVLVLGVFTKTKTVYWLGFIAWVIVAQWVDGVVTPAECAPLLLIYPLVFVLSSVVSQVYSALTH